MELQSIKRKTLCHYVRSCGLCRTSRIWTCTTKPLHLQILKSRGEIEVVGIGPENPVATARHHPRILPQCSDAGTVPPLQLGSEKLGQIAPVQQLLIVIGVLWRCARQWRIQQFYAWLILDVYEKDGKLMGGYAPAGQKYHSVQRSSPGPRLQ